MNLASRLDSRWILRGRFLDYEQVQTDMVGGCR